MTKQSGPLAGLRVLEFASIGPGPHCAMLFADMGADVVRIARRGGIASSHPVVDRGRASIEVDIKSDEGRAFCLKAIKDADVLIEGLRPGVMERLGLGPGRCARAQSATDLRADDRMGAERSARAGGRS